MLPARTVETTKTQLPKRQSPPLPFEFWVPERHRSRKQMYPNCSLEAKYPGSPCQDFLEHLRVHLLWGCGVIMANFVRPFFPFLFCWKKLLQKDQGKQELIYYTTCLVIIIWARINQFGENPPSFIHPNPNPFHKGILEIHQYKKKSPRLTWNLNNL